MTGVTLAAVAWSVLQPVGWQQGSTLAAGKFEPPSPAGRTSRRTSATPVGSAPSATAPAVPAPASTSEPATVSVPVPAQRAPRPPTGIASGTGDDVRWRAAFGDGRISADGLSATYCCAGASSTVVANTSRRTGRWYFELQFKAREGAATPDTWTNAGLMIEGSEPTPRSNDRARAQLISRADVSGIRDGQIFGVSVDLDTGRMRVTRTGQWRIDDPRDGASYDLDAGRAYVPFASIGASSSNPARDRDTWVANFGSRPFAYSIPEGYRSYDRRQTAAAGAPRLDAPRAVPMSGTPAPDSSRTVAVVAANATLEQYASAARGKLYGTRHTAGIDFAGRNLPLPPGEWKVVVSVPGTARTPIELLALARVQENRLTGLVLAISERRGAEETPTYPKSPACEARNTLLDLKVAANEANGRQDCFWIRGVNGSTIASSENAAKYVKAAVADVEASGARLPEVFVATEFHHAIPELFLRVSYLLDPSVEAGTPAEAQAVTAAWTTQGLDGAAQRLRDARRSQQWALSNWARIAPGVESASVGSR